jgi:hypothetical protein
MAETPKKMKVMPLTRIVTARGALAIACGFARAGRVNQRTGDLAVHAEDERPF